MASSLSTFALCVDECPNADIDCTSQSLLEQAAENIHRARPKGTNSLAQDLLKAWKMSDVTDAATASLLGKRIEIYVPPCGRLLEVALSLACELATIQNSKFQHVIDAGYEPPTLSCAIRVDDRLQQPPSCASPSCSERMKQLKSILKECAQGKPFGFNLWPAPPGVTSGTWFANRFDIPYLDRRCYEQDNAAQSNEVVRSLSVSELLRENRYPETATTGTLFILGKDGLTSSMQSLHSTESLSSAPVVSEWRMFEITPGASNAGDYTAAYFGEYPMERPSKPRLEEKYERVKYWDNEDKDAMKELKGARDAKGLFKAGLRLGKNKMGKFKDGQKFGINI